MASWRTFQAKFQTESELGKVDAFFKKHSELKKNETVAMLLLAFIRNYKGIGDGSVEAREVQDRMRRPA